MGQVLEASTRFMSAWTILSRFISYHSAVRNSVEIQMLLVVDLHTRVTSSARATTQARSALTKILQPVCLFHSIVFLVCCGWNNYTLGKDLKKNAIC